MGTSGYLPPTSNGGDLNDAALSQFLQQVVVGITGLPGNLVRPRWQAEPPNIPDFGTSWAAIGPGDEDDDAFAFVQTTGLSTSVISNRVLQILCSFYGPLAQTNSVILRMGLQVPQNREVMQLAGFNLVGGIAKGFRVPALMKERYQDRWDVPFRIRQQQQYTYDVESLLSAQGTMILQSSTGLIKEEIEVMPPTGYNEGGYNTGGFGR
jgi:hypothetical protein